ncbi:hypothetical protein, partial [Saccharopolyspora sp. NPDC003762]
RADLAGDVLAQLLERGLAAGGVVGAAAQDYPKARTALDPLTQNECGNRRFGGKGWTSTGVEVAG